MNAIYTCPLNQKIAVHVNPLDDTPESIRQPVIRAGDSMFTECRTCLRAEFERILEGGGFVVVGYCVLRLVKVSE